MKITEHVTYSFECTAEESKALGLVHSMVQDMCDKCEDCDFCPFGETEIAEHCICHCHEALYNLFSKFDPEQFS